MAMYKLGTHTTISDTELHTAKCTERYLTNYFYLGFGQFYKSLFW